MNLRKSLCIKGERKETEACDVKGFVVRETRER